MNAYIEFADLAKVYPTVDGPVAVVKGFDLQIEQGEFVSIIGHSGCGKSTVLSMIAGLNEISDGAIYIDGRRVVGPGPDRGVVFQSPSRWDARFADPHRAARRAVGGLAARPDYRNHGDPRCG